MSLAHVNSLYLFSGIVIKCLITGHETNREFCLPESIAEGNAATPIHAHSREDETIYVLEGEVKATIAGLERTLQAGEAVFLPRGVPHRLSETSGIPTSYAIICNPCGF